MMAAAVSTDKSSYRQFDKATISLTGHANSTTYRVTVAEANQIRTVDVTTNGSGAATVTHVVQGAGDLTVSVRPLTEHIGTTSATSTTTAKRC